MNSARMTAKTIASIFSRKAPFFFGAASASSRFFKMVETFLFRVHPEMVDFGSGQGRSEIETAGVVALRRGFQSSENVGLGRKMPFLDGHYLK